MWVRGHSRSFKLVPFESLGAVSYSPSIVTLTLSCIICEIKRDICRKSWFFHIPFAFDAPFRGGGSPSELPSRLVWNLGRTSMMGARDGEKSLRIWVAYSFWQNVQTCQTDGRTDTQTDTAWWRRPRLHSIARQKPDIESLQLSDIRHTSSCRSNLTILALLT